MSTSSSALRRAPARLVAGTVSLLLAAGSMALLPGTAQADSAPLIPSASTPTTVTADALPTVQINGVAWAQVVVGNTVYVGGKFTTARPAGAAAGTNETPRGNLLAYDIRTGALITSFAHNLDGQVLALAASPDGTRVYVGGDFTTVDGQTRRRVAAFDTATGALVESWKPVVQSQVRAIAATNDTVYLGGSITAVGSVSRSRLAAVRAADGSLLPWAPVPGVGSTAGNRLPNNDPRNQQTSDQVMALTIASTGQVIAGGRFDSMNGVKATGVAALDPVSAATRPFAVNQQLTNQGVNSAVHSLSTSGDLVIGTAYDYYGPGNLEGSFVVNADGGSIVEINDCRGDSYSNYATNGVVYVASHSHDCGNIGAFPEQPVRVHKFGVAFTLAPTGTVGSATITNANFRGQPAGSLLPWFPTMTPGTYTGQGQAGWSVAGNGQYVVYGGEFPRVNGTGQQGLVRYAVSSIAPNKVGPIASAGLTPTVVSPTPGLTRVTWLATTDNDNENLTYRVYRDGGSTPVYEVVKASSWWKSTPVTWFDPTVTAGTHTYQVVVSDPFGNTVRSGTTTATVAAGTGTVRAYETTVRNDGAQDYWPLGETTPGTAYDHAGSADLAVNAGVTVDQAGALTGDADRAYAFNGSNGLAATPTATAGPNTFTVEAWFSTTSRAGGKIVGFGNRNTDLSSSYDRHVYMDTSGRVLFGVYPGAERTVQSGTGLNDGRWHHVVASLSPAGMALYVDGVLVGSRTDTTSAQAYDGYWRVGGDRSWSGASYFAGSIDEVAVYPAALSADRVANHYSLGRTGRPTNVAPTAAVTAAANNLVVRFDGTGSRDGDGTLAGYAWDFGDGTTGTGATPSHTYAAAGNYTVTLTVTDDQGATARTTTPVTLVANQLPVASFTAAVQDLRLAVDGSASSDADGTISTYGWDFGDGSTATGATATHSYRASGSYTVTLTTTDDDGERSTATREVVVSAPIDTAPLAKDTFGRSVTGGLGTADVGGAWTASVGATRQSVATGVAELALPGAGNNTGSYLGAVSTTSADVRTSFTLSSAPTGGGTYVYVTGRRVGSGTEYRVRVRVAADGAVYLTLSRLTGNVESFPGGDVLVRGLTWTPGTSLQARVQVSGTGTATVSASVWAAGTAEPATPQLTRTDTTAALQAPGAVGLAAYRPSSSTAATAVRFTAFRVGLVGAAAHVNAAPTAAFTAEATDLTVGVDAAGSADVDGRVVTAAWTFGDGARGTGTTASHTYTAGGTYTVTLTVTDDEGATATTTRTVTVTAQGVPTALATDAFERSVAGGLGSADLGGTWTVVTGAARQAVQNGMAALTVNPGNNTGSYLAGVTATDVDVRTTVSMSAVPTAGTGAYAYVTGRRVAANLEYRGRIRVLPDGSVGVAVSRLSGAETVLGAVTTVPGLTYTAGTPLEVRVRVTGTGTTTVAVTVWPAGTPEPTTPTVVRTDSTPELQVAGGVGLAAYLSSSADVPVVARFDGLTVVAAQ